MQTEQPRRTYDHRIGEAIVESGNRDSRRLCLLLPELEIPRSTIRSGPRKLGSHQRERRRRSLLRRSQHLHHKGRAQNVSAASARDRFTGRAPSLRGRDRRGDERQILSSGRLSTCVRVTATARPRYKSLPASDNPDRKSSDFPCSRCERSLAPERPGTRGPL